MGCAVRIDEEDARDVLKMRIARGRTQSPSSDAVSQSCGNLRRVDGTVGEEPHRVGRAAVVCSSVVTDPIDGGEYNEWMGGAQIYPKQPAIGTEVWYASIRVEVSVVVADDIARNSQELRGDLTERLALVPERLRGGKIFLQKWLEVRIPEKSIFLASCRIWLRVLPHPRKIFHLWLVMLPGELGVQTGHHGR